LEELNPYTIGESSENKAFIVKEVRLWKIVSKNGTQSLAALVTEKHYIYQIR